MLKKGIHNLLWKLNYQIIKKFPRASTQAMKKLFNDKEVIGAEIGVFYGENAQSLFKELNIKELHIDRDDWWIIK